MMRSVRSEVPELDGMYGVLGEGGSSVAAGRYGGESGFLAGSVTVSGGPRRASPRVDESLVALSWLVQFAVPRAGQHGRD